MNNNHIALEELIKLGEGENLEFKSNFNNELIETLVAFANTLGGKVVVGVNQKNELIGVTMNAESVQNWINEIKNKTAPTLIPDVVVMEIGNKKAVIFAIQEYPIKPVVTRGKYFKRVANSNHLMGLAEIANEHLKTINTSWDYYPDTNHGIEHISIEKVKRFIEKTEMHSQTKIELLPLDFLSKFEIIRDKQLTFGGFLLFVKEYCLISDVQAGRFKSDTMIIDSISLNTDLFTEIDEITAFIKKHLMVEYIITGEPQHIERFDYPLDAIREIVINMVVHRDYRDSSASIIKIFDDKIVFFNPGNLYGGITVNDLLTGNYSSKTRNKLIAKAFKEIGLIERYGSGISRIRKICREYGIIEPRFEEMVNGFKVTLFKEKIVANFNVIDKVTDGVTDEVTDEVTDNQMKILRLIQKNERITTNELAICLNISQRKIKVNIAKLKEKELLVRVGNPKTGHWKISNKSLRDNTN